MSAICTCSTCRLETCLDDCGDIVPGVRRKPGVARKHELRDRFREKHASANQEEPIGDLVVLTTVAQSPQIRRLQPRRALHASEAYEDVAEDNYDDSMDISDEDAGDEQMVEDLLDEAEDDTPMMTDEGINESISTLGGIQSLLCRRSRLIRCDLKLDFSSVVPAEEPTIQSLSRAQTVNAEFLDYYSWLLQQLKVLVDLPDFGNKDVASRKRVLNEQLSEEISRVEDIKTRSWQRAFLEQILANDADGVSPIVVTPREQRFAPQHTSKPYILMAFVLVVVLHSMAAVARHETTFILASLRFMIFTALATNYDIATANRMISDIPKDIRTVLSSLNLEPEYIIYASCPRCSAIYAPNNSKPKDPYPHRCGHAEPGCPPCNASLVKPANGQSPRHTFVPLKPYPYQPFGKWLASLFARPGLEQHLETAWKRPVPALHGACKDIWDTPVIREFMGPDKQTLFSVQPLGSVHLVFSLFIDWFNPFGNKKAGKSHSIGAIYLACLNLPPDLRFRPENIYLAGIIPGPDEPSLHALNHFLCPLVDDLLVLWHKGLYISWTAAREHGRLVRAAFIPLVCDVPALRKALGVVGHGSRCSFCRLPKKQYNNLDRSLWPQPLSYWNHIKLAMRWKNASSVSERESISKDHGIRWSELLRLEYWDPTRFALIDSMHNLLLGALRHHCVEVLGIDVKGETDTKKLVPHTPSEQQMWLDKLAQAIKKGSVNAMCKPRKGYIVTMAQYNGVVPSKGFTKDAYAQAFKEWSKNNSHQLRIPPVLSTSTTDFHFEDGRKDMSKVCFLNAEVLEEIRKDIRRTVLPSWLEAPPANFGSLKHGKLKADQWRTVCTVTMVITLIRLWGASGTTDDNKLLLNNFICLVIAVDQATRYSMSSSQAQVYDSHMSAYLNGLRSLFSHNLVSNHHLSLHLTELLTRFGPVHAWWSFPFERYNGMLARFQKNYQPDKMPLTFLRSFCIGANLRWMLSTIEKPSKGLDLWTDMMKACENAFGRLPGGLHAEDVLSPHEDCDHQARYDTLKATASLSPELYQSFLHVVNRGSALFTSCFAPSDSLNVYGSHDAPVLVNSIQLVRQIKHQGHHYGKRGKSSRNSFVLLKTEATPVAAQITDIFLHSRVANGQQMIEPFFVVEEFQPLGHHDQHYDPYRAFPYLNAYLCYNKFHAPRVVGLHDIQSHFAAYAYTPNGINEECMLVRSLDRS
ncbi:hypothetical protein NM688_g7054 [Phlebia brevispora]|uniref:Uncharacterized protein n=1 Tax=Phlebia brevispora TaxID=194682 RepID=A0ACC1S9M5_9APHY|nr:hypothetical protein NM688_g7054 [Phlebia brevispora]